MATVSSNGIGPKPLTPASDPSLSLGVVTKPSSSAPPPPTIGQLWPRGSSAEVAPMSDVFPTIVYNISTNTTALALPARDYMYICTTAPITLTLPTAAGNTSRYTVKNTAATGSVTIATTASQTIDGASTFVLNVLYMSIDLVSDGSNWVVF